MSDLRLRLLHLHEWESAVKLSSALQLYANTLVDHMNWVLHPTEELYKMNYSLQVIRSIVWCHHAAHTLLDLSPAKEVCRSWSLHTDRIVSLAAKATLPTDLIVISLGKWASYELNLSSDIDLMLINIHNDSLTDQAAGLVAQSVRQFREQLQPSSGAQALFRLDFDLRPGGRFSGLTCNFDQMLDYYLNFSETWERVALIRFRPIQKSPAAADFEAFRKRFCFRRHLDFGVLEDIRRIRQMIRGSQQNANQNQLNLKFCPGGIRDIELYLHSLSVIHGGKSANWQKRSIDDFIQQAEDFKIISSHEAAKLASLYWNLRSLENFTQSLNDRQTHILELESKTYPHWVQSRIEKILSGLKFSADLTDTILGETKIFSSSQDQSYIKEFDSDEQSLISDIKAIAVQSIHPGRDQLIMNEFVQNFVFFLITKTFEKKPALMHLKDFIQSTRSKTSFYSFLNQNPNLTEELCWIFANASYLSRIVIERPELLDSFWLRKLDQPPDDFENLLSYLIERRLLMEVWAGTELMRTGDVQKCCLMVSENMREILKLLLVKLQEQSSDKLDILLLGKIGTSELGFRSDLDLVFISELDEPTADQVKLARRFISRISDPHRGGRIAEVDLRLRPSGNSGPLVVSQKNLLSYLQTQAAPWERLAYLRSSSLCGNTALIKEIQSILIRRGLSENDKHELSEIKDRLLQERNQNHLKTAEGGLLDVEIFAQVQCLMANKSDAHFDVPSLLIRYGDSSGVLHDNYLAMRKLELLWQLVTTQSVVPIGPALDSNPIILNLVANKGPTLSALMDDILNRNKALLEDLDPRRQKE